MKFGVMPVATEKQILEVEKAAEKVWYNYYKDIFSVEQIAYMLEKYQSKSALERQMSEGFIYYMLLSDNEFAGYMCISARGDCVNLERLYIQAEYRRRGLAKKTIAHLDSIFSSPEIGYTHIRKIRVKVERKNSFAKNVYEHLGFRVVGEADTDIGGGFVCQDYIMERFIRKVQ